MTTIIKFEIEFQTLFQIILLHETLIIVGLKSIERQSIDGHSKTETFLQSVQNNPNNTMHWRTHTLSADHILYDDLLVGCGTRSETRSRRVGHLRHYRTVRYNRIVPIGMSVAHNRTHCHPLRAAVVSDRSRRPNVDHIHDSAYHSRCLCPHIYDTRMA